MINGMNIADNYRHIEGPYQNCEGEKIENQILIAGGFDLYKHHYFNPQPSNGCKKVSYCTRVKCSHLSLVLVSFERINFVWPCDFGAVCIKESVV